MYIPLKYYIKIFIFYREEKDDSQKSQRTTTDPSAQEVDEDGYVLRPNPTHNWNNSSKNFYSSSDSDSGKVPHVIFACGNIKGKRAWVGNDELKVDTYIPAY